MIVTEIRKVSDKQFDLVINGTVIGSSKTDVDARVHMHFLDKLFEQEFDRGFERGQGHES